MKKLIFEVAHPKVIIRLINDGVVVEKICTSDRFLSGHLLETITDICAEQGITPLKITEITVQEKISSYSAYRTVYITASMLAEAWGSTIVFYPA